MDHLRACSGVNDAPEYGVRRTGQCVFFHPWKAILRVFQVDRGHLWLGAREGFWAFGSMRRHFILFPAL